MTSRERILAFGVAGVVGLFAADRLLLAPILAQWKEMGETRDALTQETIDAQTLIEDGPNTTRRWRGYQAAGLRDDVSSARLRVNDFLTRTADDTGLRIDALSASGDLPREPFIQVRLSISATGGLESVGGFLAAVDAAPFPLQVEACAIDASEDGSAFTARLTVSTIVLDQSRDDGRTRS